MEPCDIGQFLGKPEDCHKVVYTNGKTGTQKLSDLDDSEKELLLWRSEFQETQREHTVCLHHRRPFLEKYAFLQRECCDPFHIHPQSRRSKSLRQINAKKVRHLRRLTGRHIKPGQKWCISCVQKESEQVQDVGGEPDEEEYYYPGDVEDREDSLLLSSIHAPNADIVNQSLTGAGFSPLKAETVT